MLGLGLSASLPYHPPLPEKPWHADGATTDSGPDLLFFCLGVQRYGGRPSRRTNTISLTTKHPTYTPPPLLDPEGELLLVAATRRSLSLFSKGPCLAAGRPCLGISASSPAAASASASRWPSVPVWLAQELHLLGFQKALGCPGSAVSLQDNRQKVRQSLCAHPLGLMVIH